MRADARRNRDRVIAAAELVLDRDGAAASMREIARRANVGLATIYRHFPAKEDLFEAIVVERVNRLLATARAAAESPAPGEAFFDFFATAVADSTGQKVLVDALADAGRDPKARTGSLYEELSRLVGVMLERAKEAGEVRADLELPAVLALITAACLAADRQQWDESLRTTALGVVFDGMRPRPRAQSSTAK